MDHKNEQLIWKYLDNQCTSEELVRIRALMHSDSQFQQEIESARVIHKMLNETSVTHAPADLSARVLAQLTAKKKLKDYQGIGIRPLLIFLTALTSMIIYVGRQYQLKSLAIESIFDSYISLTIPDLEWTLPSFGQMGFYLAMVVITLPLFYFLDQYIVKKKVSKVGLLTIH